MNILIDTHCFLWSFIAPDRLHEDACNILTSGNDRLYFSAASSWEIAIKVGIGKLRLPEPPAVYVPKRIAKRGLIGLPIEHAHALHVETLPAIHKDPFDRLLVAQAQIESLTLLTADTWVTKYGGSIIWAGSRQLS